MRDFLLPLMFALIALTTLTARAADEQMSFVCNGVDGVKMALHISATSYADGTLQGLAIERRGLYSDSVAQMVKTDKMIAKSSYKPSNPRYKGMEKYAVDTAAEEGVVQPIFDWKTGKKVDSVDLSLYELILPPRADLEKIWHSPADKLPNGTFDGYMQVHFSGGDSFSLVPLTCGLNWKNYDQ